MTDTALRAGAQSVNNKHMVFVNEEHEKFYYETLEQARYQDCYHKALIYILSISEGIRPRYLECCRKQKSVEEILAEMERKHAENSTDGNKK